jgi:hypothetical protein
MLKLNKIKQPHQKKMKKFITLIPKHWGGDTKASEDLLLSPSTAFSVWGRSDGRISLSPDSLTGGEGLEADETSPVTYFIIKKI